MMTAKDVSIIVPVYNESRGIDAFMHKLNQRIEDTPGVEVIFVDGGSTDDTVLKISTAGYMVEKSPQKGRALQMNFGATKSMGRILYFLHADTIPPKKVISKITKAVAGGADSGCFRMAFDEPNAVMKLYGWFTRFDLLPFRFGDQSLFVTRKMFKKIGGFRGDHIVMEDNEMVARLRKAGRFRVLEDSVTTSARKYRENGFIRLQAVFILIFCMYWLGARQNTLVEVYRSLIRDQRM